MQALATSLDGKRVLIVEDEYLIGSDLRRIVERAGAKAYGPLDDPLAAQQMIERYPIDLALLDFRLHHADSIEIARVLKTHGVPYVVVTGYARHALPEEMQHAPYVQKPVRAGLLIDLMTGALAENTSRPT
jgi:DNA-binding NtrC family response regulator